MTEQSHLDNFEDDINSHYGHKNPTGWCLYIFLGIVMVILVTVSILILRHIL